ALDLTGNSGITDDGIAHLKVVTELVALSVKYCFQLTSNSIGYLLTLKKITYLNLTGCSKIDQSSVLYLHQLPMLRWLKIINCPKLQATKEELLRLKPNLQVITAQKERPKPDSNTSSQVSSKTTTRKDSAFPKPKPAVKVSPAFNGWIY
ncbi:MAG: hypothetical protein JWO53_240, partial [Chlamydiia bacterium]|nr:hypothetical protein [Chlamydiia bacterium]